METLVSKGSNETNTERHYQRASNHNIFQQMGSSWETERHYQRASNHNIVAAVCKLFVLKGIIKEHQITTYYAMYTLEQ